MIFSMSTQSFFLAWIGMEINLLSFIPLMLSKSKYSAESMLKYFLIQSLASIIYMLSLITQNDFFLFNILMISTLCMKMGVAPLHQWLMPVIEGMSWPNIFLLLTLQKLIPLVLLSITLSEHSTILVNFFIINSALVGSLGGLTQTSLPKIMAYSSIAHMSWLIVSLTLSDFIWTVYFSFYTLILFSAISLFHLNQIYSLNNLISKNKYLNGLLLSTVFMSLSGLPPFTGFFPKLIVMQTLISSMNLFILSILLTSTLISLFFMYA
uniref:NADH-ubiquinone oxidoreductase chain 2 n=1 Tax=Gondogeneia antarctica TaxID=1109128 RepID=G8IQP3_GONAN|nr:NADH dehydrogenase subunit 2 [Gondogeneia antarctica]